MKALSLVLAAAALLLSIGNMMWPRAPKEVVRAPVVATSPPRPPEVTAADCQAGDVKTVKGLMRKGVNPRLTAISFGLYHDQRSPQERLPAIADHADHMLGCVDALRRAANELPIESMPDYYRHLGELQQATLALRLSAMEGGEPAIKHWFDHVKQECNGCHTRFRVQTDGDDPPPK